MLIDVCDVKDNGNRTPYFHMLPLITPHAHAIDTNSSCLENPTESFDILRSVLANTDIVWVR